MITQKIITIETPGRGIYDLTNRVRDYISEKKCMTGLCHIFLHHTSASLILCENYDPLVLKDLEGFMQRLVLDGDPSFEHIEEGPDDMSAHVRSVLTTNFLQVPITNGEMALGRWQGIYLWEHRLKSHERKITLTMIAQ